MGGALLLYQHYITYVYIHIYIYTYICTFCMVTIYIYIYIICYPLLSLLSCSRFCRKYTKNLKLCLFQKQTRPYIHGLITIFHSKIVFFFFFFRCLPFSKAVKCGLSSRTPVMQSTSSYKKPPRREFDGSCVLGDPMRTQKIPWKSLQGTPWIPTVISMARRCMVWDTAWEPPKRKALVEAKTSKKVYTHMCERTALETWWL